MKRKAIAIKKKDSARILLTELLPYELPVFFSNQKFYELCSAAPSNMPVLVKRLLSKVDPIRYTIPFTYKIERGDGRRRSLSLLHPASQIKFIDFYATYDAYILNQCSKSDFSLRHPVHVGSVYFEAELKEEEENHGAEAGDLAPSSQKEQRTHASSYFYYARYNQIWKFYDSTEFRRIEQDFRSLLRLDISKCFQSIYTHSISWAVRDKAFAKQNKDAVSFDKSFDELMQSCNWAETNGIVIGPEVSRIFAEIILQRIDADVKAELVRDNLLPDKVCIRRYVDDYLIFFNADEVAQSVKRKLEESLEKYKLSFNDSKTEILRSPLISGLSIARDSVKGLLQERIANLFIWDVEGDAENNKKGHFRERITERTADQLIRALKGTIKTHGASYSTISPYALGMISRVLARSIRALPKADLTLQNRHHLYMALSFILEVVFFLYRMDVRANTTYRLASILIAIQQIAEKFGSVDKIIRQEIVDHGASVLRQLRQASISGAEASSLLACLFYVGGATAVSSADLLGVLKLDNNGDESAGYFQIVTALFCAQDKEDYENVRETACAHIRRFFAKPSSESHLSAEATLLFFDVMACPFVDDETKKQAANSMSVSASNKVLTTGEVNEIKNFCTKNLSFCDWTASGELPLMLRRKELKPAYD